MLINQKIILIIAILVSGCSDNYFISSKLSQHIWNHLQQNQNKRMNFSAIGNEEWTKVCFLGPYHENSSKTLGFAWQISDYTDVLKSDRHNVIIFATDSQVIDYVIHPRNRGDFWQLSGRCLDRENSTLVRDAQNTNWYNYNKN